ncbi:MAG: hypothetical protein NTX57_07775 [Armatimonadetes bacterium]|nr:hypothetical protein [Armatimonadota bacterium]
MDGSMGAPKRDELLSWLSEGVDVAADKALKRSRASDEDVFVEMARVVKEWLSAKEQHL